MSVTLPLTNGPLVTKHNLGDVIRVRGARLYNLDGIDVDIPRNALVAFTGVSGSGKSSLAFGTIYAEAQHRFLDSISPYARRLFQQLPRPDVDSIKGLPPAVALRQQHGTSSTRSSVGSLTALSNRLRMLFSRTGAYPTGQPHLDADCFSPNTPQGACPVCLGVGQIVDVTEDSMVPDDSLTIREKAVAAWPPAWHGQNLRDILVSLGHDVDRPWRELPRTTREWILFTDEQPAVRVYPGLSPDETKRAIAANAPGSYQGTFTSARRYVLHTLAATQSHKMRERVSRFIVRGQCTACKGKRLKPEALGVTFAGLDIAEMSALSFSRLAPMLKSIVEGGPMLAAGHAWSKHPERESVARQIANDLLARIDVLCTLGLGYLSLDRGIPTLSPGEHQRLRMATQLTSDLFGVVYVLDEPSAGLHPADTQALAGVLQQLKANGNTVMIVEHSLDLIAKADWVVDVGPGAGSAGGKLLYSGPVEGLRNVARSRTAYHMFTPPRVPGRDLRQPKGWLRLRKVTCNNLQGIDVDFPLGVLTVVTGVSGAGKSSLASRALVELLSTHIGQPVTSEKDSEADLPADSVRPVMGCVEGDPAIRRIVAIDQKPIGRTPRSNLATYTGLFDRVRQLFADTQQARALGYTAARFSFNLAEGRCQTCEGEGAVSVELLFMPSVYAPCPACKGARYNHETLAVHYRGLSIADVLTMTVEEAGIFFAENAALKRPLDLLHSIGLGHLRLGQPATEFSGGEAQRIKLATELQSPLRTGTLYVLDEPTAGLHPHDVEKFATKLGELVDADSTVVAVEHNMKVAAVSDWIVDLGPGGGDEGGRIMGVGRPADIARSNSGATPRHLREAMHHVGICS